MPPLRRFTFSLWGTYTFQIWAEDLPDALFVLARILKQPGYEQYFPMHIADRIREDSDVYLRLEVNG